MSRKGAPSQKGRAVKSQMTKASAKEVPHPPHAATPLPPQRNTNP